MVRLHLETITITDQKHLTSLPVTWFQLDGMIWISKTINLRQQPIIWKIMDDFLDFSLNFSGLLGADCIYCRSLISLKDFNGKLVYTTIF